jgi:succinate dehydrogenase / fumarate reductase cytochrome b subunit
VHASAADLTRKYRWQFSGMVAFRVQRITGLLLLAYLFLHVHTIHQLSEGPEAFDRAVSQFRSPMFKLLEIALLAVVVQHAMNGIRLLFVDFGVGQRRQRELFWILSVGLGAVVFLIGAVPLFIHSVLER